MIDLQKLQKLMGNAPTAQALREMGLTLIPVTPTGDIEEKVVAAFITAGQPAGRFFQGHKLVTPDTWEIMRRSTSINRGYDPIDGHLLSEAEAAAWAAKAPVKLPHDKGVVAMASLLAFGAAAGELNADLTSTLARLVLPKGTEPIEPPELLGDIALSWAYSLEAADIAQRRLSQGSTAAEARQVPEVEPQARTNGTPAQRLEELFLRVFSNTELRRFLAQFGIRQYLPGEGCSPAKLAFDSVGLLTRHCLINTALFHALIRERPAWNREIAAIQAAFGV